MESLIQGLPLMPTTLSYALKYWLWKLHGIVILPPLATCRVLPSHCSSVRCCAAWSVSIG